MAHWKDRQLVNIHEKDRSERAAKEDATRKVLIGTGDRSDRIRTYNFPQGRMTDHLLTLLAPPSRPSLPAGHGTGRHQDCPWPSPQ